MSKKQSKSAKSTAAIIDRMRSFLSLRDQLLDMIDAELERRTDDLERTPTPQTVAESYDYSVLRSDADDLAALYGLLDTFPASYADTRLKTLAAAPMGIEAYTLLVDDEGLTEIARRQGVNIEAATAQVSNMMKRAMESARRPM